MELLKMWHKAAEEFSKYLPLYESGNNVTTMDNVETKRRIYRIKTQGEHWAVAGKTGTGKTYAVKRIIKAKRLKEPTLNVYYLDSKKLGDFTSIDGPIVRSYEPPAPLKGYGLVQIWQPLEDDIDAYSEYFKNILDTGIPAIVDIDEAKNIVFGNKIPRGYDLLLSQGRLPGISTITSTQEVARAPRPMFSQASHILSFRVFNKYDEGVIKRYLKIYNKGSLPLAGKYSFLYIRPDIDGQPKLYKDFSEFYKEFFE